MNRSSTTTTVADPVGAGELLAAAAEHGRTNARDADHRRFARARAGQAGTAKEGDGA